MRQIPKASLENLLSSFQGDIFTKFNCHRVGVVESFDTENQTARIKLVDKTEKQTYNGNIEFNSALLIDVPVFINSDGSKGFERPILEGEECLVLFNDRDIDNWFSYGTTNQRPNSSRTHSLSDGLAIIGFHSKIKKITDFSNDLTRVRFDETVVELDDKIKIENSEENLKELISELFSTLLNLKTTPDGGITLYPIDPTTSAALTTLQLRFEALLK